MNNDFNLLEEKIVLMSNEIERLNNQKMEWESSNQMLSTQV